MSEEEKKYINYEEYKKILNEIPKVFDKFKSEKQFNLMIPKIKNIDDFKNKIDKMAIEYMPELEHCLEKIKEKDKNLENLYINLGNRSEQVMSEEEIIDIVERIAEFGWSDYDDIEKNRKVIQSLLDLYKKEKEKNKKLQQIIIMNEKLYNKETKRLGNIISELLEE